MKVQSMMGEQITGFESAAEYVMQGKTVSGFVRTNIDQ